MVHGPAALWALIAASVLVARVSVASTEFQINTYTTGYQTPTSVAADGAGNFIVVWTGRGSSGDGFDVFARRYDSTGQALGGEFQVNTYTTSAQSAAAVAADAAGKFVIVWASFGGQDGDDAGVFGRRYDSAGLPLGGEFQVNTYTTDYQRQPAVAADGAGNFLVVWQSWFQGDQATGLFGQRYDSAGLPVGSEFHINTYTTDRQESSAVAADSAGNFVVVWSSKQYSFYRVVGRRYDGAGVPLGGEFQVSVTPATAQLRPAVAADGAGNSVVVWEEPFSGSEDPYGGVHGQRLDSSGMPVGGTFQVNTQTTGAQGNAVVAADGAGNFVVVWESGAYGTQDGSYVGIFGQRYDSAGLPLGGEFQVNRYTTSWQVYPSVAADAAGNFLIVWAGTGNQDGSTNGVFGQRNKPDRLIRGKRMNVRDATGSEGTRSVTIEGRETSTEIGYGIDGDPTVVGATLRVIATGTSGSDQTYVLDASGWSRLPNGGFRYLGPSGLDGDPVKRLILHRTAFERNAFGKALLKVTLRGSVGIQSLDVVPPNLGDEGGLILQIGNGGGTYCVAFGGPAGGTEIRDTATLWMINNATSEPGCPSP